MTKRANIVMRRHVVSALIGLGALAMSAIPSAAVHAAEAGPPVTGWTPGTVACPGGIVSVFPVIIGNSTSVPRTGSFTIPAALSAIQFPSTWSAANCIPNTIGSQLMPADDSFDFTVQPGQFQVVWVGIGSNYNQGTGSNNIALGGLPSGTAGQSWYDFAVSLNGADYWTNGNSFSSMQLQYENTGGLDSATNGQDLFNIVECTAGADSVTPSSSLLTPFSAASVAGQTYGPNQPVCAGWFPEGQFQSFSATSGTGFTLQAVQTYNSGADLAFAGAGTAEITSVRITWSGPSSTLGASGPTVNDNVFLSGTPGTAGGWWMQDPATGQWSVTGATPPSSLMPLPYTSATLWINDLPVGDS